MYKISKLAVGSVMAASAALGSASLALADGYEPKGRVVYERPSDWSGVYFGVNSGYQWSTTSVENPAFPAAGITSDHNDALVGAHLGAQRQLGSIVLGIEGGWSTSIRDRDGSSEDCTNHPGIAAADGGPVTGVTPGGPVLTPGTTPGTQPPPAGFPAQCSARFSDVLTVGARVGYAAGHWMPYVTGGYANAAFDFFGRVPATNTGLTALTSDATTLVEEAHKRLNGFYIGGGFEWKISSGWTTGLEYRHYEFGDGHATGFSTAGAGPTLPGTGGTGGNPTGIPAGRPFETVRFFDTSTDTITARVSWRWGHEAAAPLK